MAVKFKVKLINIEQFDDNIGEDDKRKINSALNMVKKLKRRAESDSWNDKFDEFEDSHQEYEDSVKKLYSLYNKYKK